MTYCGGTDLPESGCDETIYGFDKFFRCDPHIKVAKNYLTEEELKILNNLVSGYFDFAEVQAMRHRPMHMSDYVEHLDRLLSLNGEEVLQNAGKVSHQQAMDKAEKEYRIYQKNTLSPVEESYLQAMKELEKDMRKDGK